MKRAQEAAAVAAVLPDDTELVHRALARDGDAFRTIMQTHNRKLYRIARSIVQNEGEAEDVVQESYVHAFTHLDSFRGDARLSTWLARIVINEALGRLRRRRRTVDIDTFENRHAEAEIIQFPMTANIENPEQALAQRQIMKFVEAATDNLPDIFRTVFVARVIEGMSVDETAELLGLRVETVRTRLHRARHLVRKQLDKQIGPLMMGAFPFAGKRCARMTDAVLGRFGLLD